MRKSELKQLVATAKDKRAAGEISATQYDHLMDLLREHLLHHNLEDPVWEKPMRPISKPRPHIRGAYRKYLDEGLALK